jgi:hypothetical protein
MVNALATLIASLFGFFLITCAIFATPWVSCKVDRIPLKKYGGV